MANPTTREVLHSMFTENTGVHICDSGGLNGRAWQQNRENHPEVQPEVKVTFYGEDGEAVEVFQQINAYKWCLHNLEYSPEWQTKFEKHVAPDRPHLADMYAFMDAEFPGRDVPTVWNTYNDECNLDHTLQFGFAERGHGDLIILQVHTGADARTGYTAPKVFEADDIHDFADWQAPLHTPKTMWWPDGPYWLHHDDLECNQKHFEDYMVSADPAKRGKGFVYLSKEGVYHCPITGEHMLTTYGF